MMLPAIPFSVVLALAAVAVLTTAIARHPGRCAICADPIQEGEIIAYDETAEAWCHEECCEESEATR